MLPGKGSTLAFSNVLNKPIGSVNLLPCGPLVDPLGDPLGDPIGDTLGDPLGDPLVDPLGDPIGDINSDIFIIRFLSDLSCYIILIYYLKII